MDYLSLISAAQTTASLLDVSSEHENSKGGWQSLRAEAKKIYRSRFFTCKGDTLQRGHETLCYILQLLNIDLVFLNKIHGKTTPDNAGKMLERLAIWSNAGEEKRFDTPFDPYIEFCQSYAGLLEGLEREFTTQTQRTPPIKKKVKEPQAIVTVEELTALAAQVETAFQECEEALLSGCWA